MINPDLKSTSVVTAYPNSLPQIDLQSTKVPLGIVAPPKLKITRPPVVEAPPNVVKKPTTKQEAIENAFSFKGLIGSITPSENISTDPVKNISPSSNISFSVPIPNAKLSSIDNKPISSFLSKTADATTTSTIPISSSDNSYYIYIAGVLMITFFLLKK